MNNIIEIRNLSKSFGPIQAVDDLSFQVREGELFAFLGVNGAGKSTTISILCGQLAADSGTVVIDGCNIRENPDGAKRKLGVVYQESALDRPLTVYDNLASRAALYGITGKEFRRKLAELAEILDFGDLLNRAVRKLSGGQRRRIDIARALLHDPEILILDEPTTGLDPQTRRMLWDVISQLRRERKMTVFLTTHYMEEAADADFVVILDSGRIAAEGTPLQLKNAYSGDFITLYGADPAELAALGLPCEVLKDACRLSVPNTGAAAELILKYPQLFRDFEMTKGKMDDIFLAATGKRLTGGAEK